MLRDVWEAHGQSGASAAADLQTQAGELQTKIDRLVNRLVEAEDEGLIVTYEKKITDLHREKQRIEERSTAAFEPRHSFEKTFRLALCFLANPWKLWGLNRLDLRRAVLRLAFPDRLAYDWGEGLRTPKTAYPFKALAGFCASNYDLVEPRGIEPLTFALRTRRSPI